MRQDLQSADKVALKIDGVTKEQVRRVNRPVGGSELADIWSGMEIFSQNYPGELAIQTMLLSPWDEPSQREYIDLIQRLQPKEIQLNTPTRPKPLQRQLDGRGNHSPEDVRPYQVQLLKSVDRQVLRDFAAKIEATTKIPVRYP